MRTFHAPVVFAVLATVGTTVSAQTFSWDNPAGGNWNIATNWAPVGVPDTLAESASIGLLGTYSVTFDSSSIGFDALTITNPNATLDVIGGRNFDAQSLTSNARIRVNPNQGTSTTRFIVADGQISGTVELFTRGDIEAPSSTSLISETSELVLPAGSVIAGSGRVTNSTFSNTMFLAGQLRAQAGFGASPLVVERYDIVDMSGGGELVADGNTLVYAGTLRNGTIRAVNGGGFGFDVIRLENMTIDLPGTYDVASGDSTTARDGTVFPGGVRVNPTNGTSTTTFRLDDDMTPVPDLVELFTRTDIPAAANGTLVGGFSDVVVPGTSVIRGSGRITNAAVSGNTLSVQGQIRAQAGFGAAPLSIDRYDPIDLSGGGELVADGNTLAYSGTIANGTIRAENNGDFDFGVIRLNNVVLDVPGAYVVDSGDSTTAREGTLFTSGVRVNPTNGTSTTTFRIDDDATPVPDSVELFTRTDLPGPNNATFTFGVSDVLVPASSVVRGSGRITNAAVSGNTLSVQGQIRAQAGFGAAPLSIDRYNPVDLSAGGELVADGNALVYSGRVVGGTVRAINGGELDFGSVTLEDVSVVQDQPYDVDPGETLVLAGMPSLPSGIRVNPQQDDSTTTLRIADEASPDVGLIELFTSADIASLSDATFTSADRDIELPASVTIRGSGRITNDVTSGNTLVNGGTIAADPAYGLAGLVVDSRWNTFVQTSTGRLGVYIDPDGPGTTLVQSGDVTLAGELRATFAPGYTPEFGDTFEIFENAVSGEFDSFEIVDSNGLPFVTDLVPFVFYRNDGVFVSWTCVPDSNTDLLINILDVIDFINIWNNQSPGADFNGDGNVNILDVVGFINEWGQGCP